jgi:anthranilate synthase component 1
MLAETTAIQTIVREIPADLETPTSLYLKLRGQAPSFLLESVEGGERIARYSFIGVAPRAQYVLRANEVEIIEGDRRHIITLDPGSDPTRFLESELRRFQSVPQAGLPRFIGGLVGYLGYESVRHFEPTLSPRLQPSALPDGIYLLVDTIIAFDHARRSLSMITNVLDGDADAANRKLDEIGARIRQPLPPAGPRPASSSPAESNLTQDSFEGMVRAAKEHIAAGDIFQVVLSQKFSRETQVEPFDVYRAVRRLNPSPYMFFFDFGLVDGEPLTLAGSSPEVFVRLEGRTASLRPIAGTRPRGADAAADSALAQELLADPKERAEHVMLVDLGRNDLGRVCEYGTVKVTEFFTIERYSHVMHIVSNVEGTLSPKLTAFDLVRAAFPAGTVSGAPKVRAMEIIAELEPAARGPYAGMIGYFGFDGAMDTCLAIRTMVGRGRTFSVQAGAGIVADSDPAREYQETVNKASAMLKAIEMAESDN